MRDTFDAFTPPNRDRFGDNECAPESATKDARSNLVDLLLRLENETVRALGVSRMDVANSPIQWLPKSQIEFQITSPFAVQVTLPRWLAREKGLVS